MISILKFLYSIGLYRLHFHTWLYPKKYTRRCAICNKEQIYVYHYFDDIKYTWENV